MLNQTLTEAYSTLDKCYGVIDSVLPSSIRYTLANSFKYIDIYGLKMSCCKW